MLYNKSGGRAGCAFRFGRVFVSSVNFPVLIVDDFSTMRRIIRHLLVQIGFTHIEEASDGTEALKKMRRTPVKLVFSDWNMTPMSGIDLVREMRADEQLHDTPLIMITSEARWEKVKAAKEVGVANFIVKPFNAETLKRKIETAIGRSLD